MTTATTQEAPRRRPKDRRAQILREAFDLIAVAGFNAVSLADVARASGIQKSSVLHHFPSMNDLLLAVLELREQDSYFHYSAEPTMLRPDGPATARALFTRVFEHNLERPQLVRLYAILSAEAVSTDHPAHEYLAARDRQARAELTGALAWKPDPELAAVELLSFWNGLDLVWTRDTSIDARAVWAAYCDRFFAPLS